MKLYDVTDSFDKYTDVQIYYYINDRRELLQNNLRLIDKDLWIRHLADDVIDCIPMGEKQYNDTVNSNKNPYIEFGFEYDYTDAKVLVITLDQGDYGI